MKTLIQNCVVLRNVGELISADSVRRLLSLAPLDTGVCSDGTMLVHTGTDTSNVSVMYRNENLDVFMISMCSEHL